MLSLFSSYRQGKLQSKLYKAQAATLRANAQGTRNRANAQAAAIEHAAAQNQHLAAQNLTKAQANKRAALATQKTARVWTGFDTQAGTATQAHQNQQDILDAEIANMELAASISMSNAWQSAIDTRRQGHIEATAQEAQADQYAMAGKTTARAATLGLISGIANAAIGAYSGYQSATTHNAEQYKARQKADAAAEKAFQNGTLTFEEYEANLNTNLQAYNKNKVSVAGSMYTAASQAGYSGFHFLNTAFNPYTGALSQDANNRKNNWGGALSVLLGNVPYKIPASGTIFAQY